MPFPTTVHVSRIVKAPPGERDDIVERVADALRRNGLPGVTTGQSVVRFDAAGSPEHGNALASTGEIEIVARGADVELVAEAEVGRIPLTFGIATMVSATIVGGPDLVSLGGGLAIGALIALVPWGIARIRLAGTLRRIAQLVEGRPHP